jgi:hypothetical protein
MTALSTTPEIGNENHFSTLGELRGCSTIIPLRSKRLIPVYSRPLLLSLYCCRRDRQCLMEPQLDYKETTTLVQTSDGEAAGQDNRWGRNLGNPEKKRRPTDYNSGSFH